MRAMGEDGGGRRGAKVCLMTMEHLYDDDVYSINLQQINQNNLFIDKPKMIRTKICRSYNLNL